MTHNFFHFDLLLVSNMFVSVTEEEADDQINDEDASLRPPPSPLSVPLSRYEDTNTRQ